MNVVVIQYGLLHLPLNLSDVLIALRLGFPVAFPDILPQGDVAPEEVHGIYRVLKVYI